MGERICQFCRFAGPAEGLDAGRLVCAHSQAATGSYRIVACAETCDDFQPADIATLGEGQSEFIKVYPGAPGVHRGSIGVISTGVLQRQRLSFRAKSRNPLNRHRRRRYRNCAPDTLTFASANRTRLIPVKGGPFAIVDAADYETLSKYRWYAKHTLTTCYAVARHKGKFIQMHRLITDAPRHLVVDHIDHNGLNNTRINLRLCKQAENARNQGLRTGGTSKYKGVSWHAHRRKFRARIAREGKVHFLGYFTDEKEAARAYDKKARVLFGEFAYLNFPDEHAEPDDLPVPRQCKSKIVNRKSSIHLPVRPFEIRHSTLFSSSRSAGAAVHLSFVPFHTRGPPQKP